MQYTCLGRTGLKVSRLCLGTFNFYHVTSEEEALELLDQGEALGINFIDTANIYGKENKYPGAAESLIGSWLKKSNGRRNNFVIATKVFGPMGLLPNQGGLSAYHIRQACEDSLRRLGTDHIDIYQMHYLDKNTPLEEIWQAFSILIQQGKVIYIGSSNFAAWQIMKAQNLAEKNNLFGIVSEQSVYNLMERTVELEVLPTIRELGIGFLPWSPLAGGLLAGYLSKKPKGRRSLDHKKREVTEKIDSLTQFEGLCERVNLKPSHVALAWLLHNKDVTSPIVGARNAEQLVDSAKAIYVKLNEETLIELDQIWQGPGEAPQSYTKWGSPR